MKSLKLLSLVLLALTGSPVVASESTTSAAVGEISAIATDVKTSSSAPVLTRDALFDRLTHQESRGNQFGRNGLPLTSPKGAVGVAQIMPETAPEASRLAGLAWDHWRYRNDATYNMALGRAYLDSQLDRYDGNHILALAAYNAGPGRVDQWLKRFGDPRSGQISNDDFIRLIPFRETQEYVSTILNGAPAKYAYTPSRNKPGTTAGQKFEFKDTHPGFTFSVAVSRSFDSHSKLVGGL
ncbi:TPA: lytic transglycosylase domain-containing protein [Enterobacter cloacae]|nr:lytic transglycosylase domain-containing protein [Enterobacter cloacae]